jgi:hypothetical protein
MSYSIIGSGDGGEVRDQRVLRGLVVVRRHDQQSVGTGILRLVRELEGVRGAVRAHAGDDRGPIADRLRHSSHDRALLGVGGRRRFARGAVHDKAVVAIVHESGGQRRHGGQVDRTVSGERRHHRGQDTAEGRTGVSGQRHVLKASVAGPSGYGRDTGGPTRSVRST